MNRSLTHGFLLGAALSGCFVAGTLFAEQGGGHELLAQGRGPITPPPAVAPQPLLTAAPEAAGVVYTESNQVGVASNGILAVTGSYGVGTSVLYLIDTVHRQLAVYEAKGGASGSRRVVLVGARRIDLDLQLQGYNDKSDYQFEDLKRLFETRERRAKGSAAPVPGERKD